MNHGTYINHKASETFLFNAIISFSAGLQDAYTYFFRNNVFANAQTGNVVLMGHYFMTGKIDEGIQYLAPLFSFAFGVVIAENICHLYKDSVKIHWRQIVLILEILVLFSVGFIPTHYNMLASSLVSLSCAMQIEAFKTVHGFGYASTMCIGNLRSGMESLSSCIRNRDKSALLRVYYYYGVIISFAIGAGVGGLFSELLELKTIWICCIVLMICCLLMMRKHSIFHIKNKKYYFNKKNDNDNKNMKNKNNKSALSQNTCVDIELNIDEKKNNTGRDHQRNDNINGRKLSHKSIGNEMGLNNNSFIQDMVDDDIVQENFSSIQKIIEDDIENSQNNLSLSNITIGDAATPNNISHNNSLMNKDRKRSIKSFIHNSSDEDATKNDISKINTMESNDEIALNDSSTLKNLAIDNTAPKYITIQNLMKDNSDHYKNSNYYDVLD